MAQHSDLPIQHSFITTHTEKGDSVFLPEASGISEDLHFKAIGPTISKFADLHASPSIPVSLNEDLGQSKQEISTNVVAAGVLPQGASFRRTDMPPAAVSPMHRTLTLDYGVVVAGSVELILESGEKRTMKQGDTVVQRGTMHQWRNAGGEGEWCRMVWVQLPIQDFEIDEKKLQEEYRIPGKPAP
jgi:quercetin dioxygenase-like cupin family protein